MAFVAKEQAGFEELEPGFYHMVISQVVIIGTPVEPDQFGKRRQQVRIVFELPDEIVNIDGDDKRRTYSQFFSTNLKEKWMSKLIAAVNNGKGITAEERVDGYELGNLIGQNFAVSVGFNDKGKLRIESIQKHKGEAVMADEPRYFDPEDYEKAGHKFPEWMSDGVKRLLMACEEYKLPF